MVVAAIVEVEEVEEEVVASGGKVGWTTVVVVEDATIVDTGFVSVISISASARTVDA